MKVIIPMAGMGKRLRPFTLNKPKPLLKINGKTIVEHLLNNIQTISNEKIEEIGFVIGKFSSDIKEEIKNIAKRLNVKYKLFLQNVPLGTAHAIYMAEEILDGKVIIAFADTIFIAKQKLDTNNEAIIFTKKVDKPEQYGVVQLDKNNNIVNFVEKPKKFISNLAIIGIYYFRQAEVLRDKIKYLIDNNIMVKNEYQLTDALDLLLKQGLKFKAYTTEHWLDCGNPKMLLNTNKTLLQINHSYTTYNQATNSIIIPPNFIGKNVLIENSIIGPFVNIEDNTTIKNSIIKNSIIYNASVIESSILENSIIGSKAFVVSASDKILIGDYSKIYIDDN